MRSSIHEKGTLLIGIVLALACCAGPQAALQIQALPVGQSSAQRLPIDGTLHSGDQFLLEVEVPHASYVYVFRPNGEQPERLFPLAEDVLVPAQAPFYIPASGQYFTLGAKTGRETLVVIVSGNKLGEGELAARVSERLNMIPRDGSSRPPPPPPMDPRPPIVGPRDRDGDLYVVRARFDKQAVAVLSFPLNHEAPASK